MYTFGHCSIVEKSNTLTGKAAAIWFFEIKHYYLAFNTDKDRSQYTSILN